MKEWKSNMLSPASRLVLLFVGLVCYVRNVTNRKYTHLYQGGGEQAWFLCQTLSLM